MKECDNSKIYISSNFILSICFVIMFDTLLLRPSLHCNTPLHFTALHPTTLLYTLSTLHHNSTNYTSLHVATLHQTSPKYTSLHFVTIHHTSTHYTLLHLSTLHFLSFSFTHLHFLSSYFTSHH
jgi:hypothetical protein